MAGDFQVGPVTVAARPTLGLGDGGISAGLQAELARLKKAHAARVNGTTANTFAGQRDIQQLEVQIKQIEVRVSAVLPIKPPSEPEAAPASPPPSPAERTPAPTVRRRINVYA
jgi:hypothetical protein